ncbi:AAA family ATPase, partial [Streptomyces sp. NPDC007983]|uniref:AAA family ATPase n=1 Tax=Streptomyces sp. NPDC007983 TaxID=3364800 RepID=UPI0036E3AC1B
PAHNLTSARSPPITTPTTELATSHGKHRCSTRAASGWSDLHQPIHLHDVGPVEGTSRTSRGQPTGLAAYLVAEAVADGVLGLGQSMIIDAVNAVEVARQQWRALADLRRVPLAFIEVVCSDPRVHRQRLERRSRGIEGFEEPTWEAVQQRRAEYEPWTDHRLVLDSIADLTSNLVKAQEYVAARARSSQSTP